MMAAMSTSVRSCIKASHLLDIAIIIVIIIASNYVSWASEDHGKLIQEDIDFTVSLGSCDV
jgi:hypothetical protein